MENDKGEKNINENRNERKMKNKRENNILEA